MNEETIGEWTKIEDLNPWKDNPRINQSAIDEVAKSIKRFGFASPIIARSEDLMIIAGHTRFEAAKKLGLQKVPVRLMNLDIGEAQLLALADNKIGEIADWDEEKLKAILSDLKDEDLAGLGWSDEELADLIDYEPQSELHGDPDEVPEVQEDAITQEGDLWILGNHRLHCGDSTKEENVAVLMNGEKADMVFTDPPYGMDLETDYQSIHDQNNEKYCKSKSYKKVLNDEKEFDPATLIEMFNDAKEQFWWGADWYYQHLPKNGSFMIWNKRTAEGTKKMLGNHFETLWTINKKRRVIIDFLWAGFTARNKDFKRSHPTEKPIALLVEILNEYTNQIVSVVDLFGGVGTTLIACEQTNRKCFMMELDPHYCDVIVRRWQNLTGKEAVNQNGQSFNDISDLPW
tara:strand:- start:190 stop:1395 length:1206 start_codon:yes stop_codon:yes gene_type:complete